MPIFRFQLYLDSPAFIAGTDKNNPEMRAASIRGQLRYWLRAMLGASTNSLADIWKAESDIFGSTEKGSQVGVRVFPISSKGNSLMGKIPKYPLLPHREGTSQNVSMIEAIAPKEIFDLELVTRPGVPLPPNILHALKIWSLLGGIGRRSRRMMGAINIKPAASQDPNINIAWYEEPKTAEEYKKTIIQVLNDVITSPITISTIPSFPVLQSNHCWIVIGKKASSYKEANQVFFREFLRNDDYKPQQDVFGYSKGSRRRASPIIAQVRKIGSEFYPIITAFRSEPLKAGYSDTLHNFMHDILNDSGIQVWGGW